MLPQAIPAILGWAEVFRDQRLFSICGDCAWDNDDAELEQEIHAKVWDVAPTAVAAETMASPPAATAHEVQAAPAA